MSSNFAAPGAPRRSQSPSLTVRTVAWRVLAVIALVLGLIGLALPIVPQVPFLLVAAAAAARGWPALDQRLRSHPRYGPAIARWRERRAMSRQIKTLGTIGLLGALAATAFLPLWAQLA